MKVALRVILTFSVFVGVSVLAFIADCEADRFASQVRLRSTFPATERQVRLMFAFGSLALAGVLATIAWWGTRKWTERRLLVGAVIGILFVAALTAFIAIGAWAWYLAFSEWR
jgi:hypothetical protein